MSMDTKIGRFQISGFGLTFFNSGAKLNIWGFSDYTFEYQYEDREKSELKEGVFSVYMQRIHLENSRIGEYTFFDYVKECIKKKIIEILPDDSAKVNEFTNKFDKYDLTSEMLWQLSILPPIEPSDVPTIISEDINQ